MAEPIRIHLRVPGTAPMPDLMRLLRSIEAAGFDGAGILDSQMLSRDTFVVLGQAATNTSRLTLFPAVTNPFTRHPAVLAGAIQTVEEMAPGRVKFVIGTGYTSASTIGRKPATLAEMRACIGIVRGLLAGESVDFAGMPGRLGWTIVRVPFDVAKLWGSRGALRVRGEINGFDFRTSLFPTGQGTHYILINKKMQQGGAAHAGEQAEFTLEPDTKERPIVRRSSE